MADVVYFESNASEDSADEIKAFTAHAVHGSGSTREVRPARTRRSLSLPRLMRSTHSSPLSVFGLDVWLAEGLACENAPGLLRCTMVYRPDFADYITLDVVDTGPPISAMSVLGFTYDYADWILRRWCRLVGTLNSSKGPCRALLLPASVSRVSCTTARRCKTHSDGPACALRCPRLLCFGDIFTLHVVIVFIVSSTAPYLSRILDVPSGLRLLQSAHVYVAWLQ